METDAGRLSDQLALILAARLAVAMRQSPSTAETDDHDQELRRLRDLCAALVPLRKGDHTAQKLSLERQKLDRKY